MGGRDGGDENRAHPTELRVIGHDHNLRRDGHDSAVSDRLRQEIIGEAMRRLEKDDADTAARIAHYRRIIAFRNVLIHGYDVIDPAIVWSAIADDLEPLLADVQKLLA